jgi:hypothetical protein
MKKIMFVLLAAALTVSAFPQEKKGGYITLTLNDKKIELPIFTVMLRKENAVIVTARGEKNTEDIAQMISMEFRLKGLYKDSIDAEGFGLDIVNSDKKNDSSEDLSLRMDNYIRYSKRSKQSRTHFEVNSFEMKFNISNIDFRNNRFIIEGVFNLRMRSKDATSAGDILAEVKDGSFRIEI